MATIRRGGWSKLLLFFLLLLAGAGCDGMGSGEEPSDDAGDLLYVCNQAAAPISVIDTEINDVIHTLELTDYGLSETACGATSSHEVST